MAFSEEEGQLGDYASKEGEGTNADKKLMKQGHNQERGKRKSFR